MVAKHIVPLFVLAAALCAVKSQAQEQKNYLSGSIGFRNAQQENSIEDAKSNSFNISPTYGHYLSKKFSIGISVGYIHTKSEQKVATSTITSNGFNVSPFVRFEQPIWDNRLAVINDVGLRYGHSKGSTDLKDGEASKNTTNSGSAFYRPGLLVNFTKRSSLILSLGDLLSVNHYKDKSTTNGTTQQTNAGIQSDFGINNLSFGFQYKF